MSTALEVDDSGQIVGWDRSTLVHVMNKHEVDHPELLRSRAEKPNAIAVGDGLGDADMVPGNALRIRVLDMRDDESADIGSVRSKTLERFDAILETGNFRLLAQLIGAFVSNDRTVR